MLSPRGRAAHAGGIIQPAHNILAYPPPQRGGVLQRNLVPKGRGINISGVDFWHAVEFSRNGSFPRNRSRSLSGLSLRFPQLIRSSRTRFPLCVHHPAELTTRKFNPVWNDGDGCLRPKVPRTTISSHRAASYVPATWARLGAGRAGVK